MSNNANNGSGNPEESVEFSPPTTEQLNMRCTGFIAEFKNKLLRIMAGVKRLLKEAMELRNPNELFCAKPMEDNLFEWHFSVRGPPDTPYADGIYHGRVVLPAEYPMKPPNLILLTPNGRFETNKKICLSISGYHPETWLPSWSIRTALLALIGFMPTHSAGALGGLECSQEERRRLAIKSLDWRCPQCNLCMRDALPPLGSTRNAQKLMEEVKSASSPKTAAKSTETGSSTPLVSATNTQTHIGSENIPNVTAKNPIQSSATDQIPATAVTPPPTTSPTTVNRAASGGTLLDNPLPWMLVLSVVFLALLLRRILLNMAPTGSEGQF